MVMLNIINNFLNVQLIDMFPLNEPALLSVWIYFFRSLLVYIRNRQEFRHYDSSRDNNKEIARKLAYKLQPFVHGNQKLQTPEACSAERALASARLNLCCWCSKFWRSLALLNMLQTISCLSSSL